MTADNNSREDGNVGDEYQLPLRGHITAVHRDIRASVYKFRDEMLRLESDVLRLQIQQEPGIATQETLAFFKTKSVSQMYSRAVQVFAALAVEAFINEYAYLRLGEEEFKEELEWASTIKKLRAVCLKVFGAFDDNGEIVTAMKNLAERRNRLVHPKPEMLSVMEGGTVRETTHRLASSDPGSAEAATWEMDRFFQLFPSVDAEAAMFFRL
jgi:hypothetical protein